MSGMTAVAQRRRDVDGPPQARRVRDRSARRVKDPSLWLLVTLSGALWAYVGVRAARLSVTIDEGGAFAFSRGDASFINSANNHWLNSLGVRVSQQVFGESELALRLPNVAAFGIYTAAVIWIVARVRHLPARLLGFALLMANPFIVEFFGLARGYGLAMAFVMLALAGLLAVRPRDSSTVFVVRVVIVCVAGLLAVYSYFGALNVVLATLGVLAIDIVAGVRRAGKRRATGAVVAAVTIVTATAAGLVPAVTELMQLERRGELYYGGKRGLLPDTLISFLETSSYRYTYPAFAPAWATTAEVVFTILLAAALCWAAITAVGRRRRWGDMHRAALVGITAIAAVQVQAMWRGTLYPIDRTALVYALPLLCFAMLVVADLHSVGGRWIPRAVSTAAMAAIVLLAGNFAAHANVERTAIWAFDASTRQVIDEVAALQERVDPSARPTPHQRWTLITGFPRNESFNYYRVRDDLAWLNPVLRTAVDQPGGDLYYVADSEVPSLPVPTRLVKSFSVTRTQLRVPADSPLAR